MNRVRYFFNKNLNLYQSTRAIPTSSEDVVVEMNLTTGVARVLSAVDGRALHILTSNTSKKLKIQVKDTLMKMGAPLETETRTRKSIAS